MTHGRGLRGSKNTSRVTVHWKVAFHTFLGALHTDVLHTGVGWPCLVLVAPVVLSVKLVAKGGGGGWPP